MDSLKHNQPQVSVVRFNQKNVLDFSMQPFFLPTTPMMRDGVKSQKIFRLRRNYNFKTFHAFVFFLLPLDS